MAFANILRGVPIDGDMEYTGGFFNLLNPYALLGGVMTLTLFLTHGAMFVSLKTDGRIRVAARRARAQGRPRRRRRRRRLPAVDPDRHGHASASAVAFVAGRGRTGGRALAVIRAGREGWAFIGTFAAIALGVAGLFLALFPDVMPTSLAEGLSPDHDQRGGNATTRCKIMTVVAVDLHAGGARLPGLDLLGLPQADRRAPHPRRHARRRVRSRAG